MKSLVSIFAIVIAISFFSTTSFFSQPDVVKASATDTVTGAAWSSNIGYISMNNCTTPTNCSGASYGVTMAQTGTSRNLTGYGWSANVGWISFNPAATSGCPASVPASACQARVEWGAAGGPAVPVKGWARACSVYVSGCSGAVISDPSVLGGWDGWIALGDTNTSDTVPFGVTLNTTTGVMSSCSASGGCAWGSEVVGWVDFSQVKITDPTETCTDTIQNQDETGVDTGGVCAPVVTLIATPNPVVASGNRSNLTWTVTWGVTDAANTCDATENWTGKKNILGGGPEQTIPITGPTPFTLTCSGKGGTDSAQVIVTVNTDPSIFQCNDGTDNDGDGKPDALDPGCWTDPTNPSTYNPTDNDEFNTPPAEICGNGIDDDGVGGDAVCPPVVPPLVGVCSNIPDTVELTPSFQAGFTIPPYRKLADGRCLCAPGFSMNAAYQCVKPVYLEQ